MIPLLEQLREITGRSALVVFPINEWFLAYAYALVGHPEAADLLRHMEQLTDDARFTYYYPFWLTLLGENGPLPRQSPQLVLSGGLRRCCVTIGWSSRSSRAS